MIKKMLKVKVLNQEGKEVESVELPASIFDVEVKPTLIKEVVDILSGNRRRNLAHAKRRQDVRGGGIKPWRQKGTGRARHGSIRSPLWKGGGVTFGPTKDRNFKSKVNSKVKKAALKMVLTNKLASDHFILIDKLELKDSKTKELQTILDTVIGKRAKAVVVLSRKSEKLVMAANNLSGIATAPATSLNILELLKYPYLVVTTKAIDKIIKTYQ